MRANRDKEIVNTVGVIAKTVGLPDGYRLAVSRSNPGDGRRYSIAVIRDDYKGGEFISLPSFGSLRTNDACSYVRGILDGVELAQKLARLPKRI